jgi:AcrR family transcriptional regulator
MAPRADAVRNRARVLQAAEEVFTANGESASTEEIARAAGVGIGTVFRHFPTKEDLLQAVVVGRMRDLADAAAGLAGSADPATALAIFLRQAVERGETKRALADLLSAAGRDVRDATADARRDLRAALAVLLRNAQQAGAVRRDLRVDDVMALLAGASRAVEVAATAASRNRVLTVILAGISPVAGTSDAPPGGRARA